MLQLFAVRDAMLGVGLVASSGDARRTWWKVGIACDLADAAAAVIEIGSGQIPRNGRTAFLLAASPLSAASAAAASAAPKSGEAASRSAVRPLRGSVRADLDERRGRMARSQAMPTFHHLRRASPDSRRDPRRASARRRRAAACRPPAGFGLGAGRTGEEREPGRRTRRPRSGIGGRPAAFGGRCDHGGMITSAARDDGRLKRTSATPWSRSERRAAARSVLPGRIRPRRPAAPCGRHPGADRLDSL